MPGYPKSCRGGSKRGHTRVVLALLPFALLPGPASAQLTVETRVEENFRREPQGQVLGRVGGGTPLLHVSSQGSWTEVTLEGWVWTASLQATDRESFGLVISATGGENVRSEPSGPILGRLEQGTLLDEVERRPGWTRVRRTGWVWSASVTAVQTSVGTPASGSAGSAPSRAPAPAVPSADRFARLGNRTPILSAPDGDTLALLSSAADVEVLAREGNWTRVRLDGWVWRPRSADAEASEAEDASSENVTPAMLVGAGGDAYEGRRVTWRVQFISLERAEAIRTDFFEGEPFILGRFGGAEGPFVYVTIPPERLAEVQGLIPLEVVIVTGRVRRASSALTETPILELLGVERGSGS